MKAIDVGGQAPGGKRTLLAQALPLRTPFVVQIFPVYACNFTCRYCIFSVDKSKRGFISDEPIMEFGLYKKCVDEIALFADKLKVLRFVGMGEPLLHPEIAGMIQYAVSKDVADRVELLTNASLLTRELSDALITAGLNRLVVSLQGTTKKKYLEVCGANMDFENFVDNLRYFFNHKCDAQMYIKIVDYALDNNDDRKRFYEIFGDICDTIAVEHVGPIYPGVDYENVLKNKDTSCTQFGLPVSEVQICPQPYFTLQINPDGKVVPCYSIVYPGIMGDCNNQSVREIWNGEKFSHFRSTMLDGIKNMGDICANCPIIRHRLFPEDNLNNDVKRLKKIYDF